MREGSGAPKNGRLQKVWTVGVFTQSGTRTEQTKWKGLAWLEKG